MKRRAGLARALWLAALFAAPACARREPPAPQAGPQLDAQLPAPAKAAASAARDAAATGPRVKAVQGELASGAQLVAGEQLAPDRALELPPGAELTLDFAQGARLRVLGPARLLAAPGGADAVLLQHGSAALELPPAAPRPDAGFWLATPSLRLELARSGRVAVRAFADGSSALFVVSSGAQLTSAVDAAPVLLEPGSALQVAPEGRVERSRVGALTLDAALARARGLSERAAAAGALQAPLEQELSQQADRVSADVARERELVAAHRARIGSEGALPAQAALAAHAAILARSRARLRGLLSQRAAARLLLVPGPDDALGARAQQLLAR